MQQKEHKNLIYKKRQSMVTKLFYQQEKQKHLIKQISFVQAALGDEVTIPTVEGKGIELKIPAGTQSGSVFRLRGEGMPTLRANNYGNLYVTATIVTPQKLNSKQTALLKEFAEVSGEEISRYEKTIFDKVKDVINH